MTLTLTLTPSHSNPDPQPKPKQVPYAANFVVSTFVIVEMAEEGNEGLVYGLLTTTANLGSPVARAIGNQLFGLFRPWAGRLSVPSLQCRQSAAARCVPLASCGGSSRLLAARRPRVRAAVPRRTPTRG